MENSASAPESAPIAAQDAASNTQEIQTNNEAEKLEAVKDASANLEAQPEAKDDKFAKKFAALSRREKATRQRESELKAMEQAILAKQQELDNLAKPKAVETAKEIPIEVLGKKDPLAALQKMGWDYEKLTKFILNDNKLDPDSQIQLTRDELRSEMEEKFNGELSSIRKQLEEKEAREAEAIRAQQEAHLSAVIENFKGEIGEFVEKNKETYELAYINEAQDLIFETVDAYYNKYGKVLTVEEATKTVEQYLEEEASSLYSKSNKLKAKLGASSPKKELEPETTNTSSFTLTNEEANQSPSDKKTYLSDEESKKLAAKMIRFNK